MNTTVKMLQHVLLGLPESCIVKLSVDGKLYDFDVAGITRTGRLPHPSKFHTINEFVILADNGNFEIAEKAVEIKKVFKAIEGRIDDGR